MCRSERSETQSATCHSRGRCPERRYATFSGHKLIADLVQAGEEADLRRHRQPKKRKQVVDLTSDNETVPVATPVVAASRTPLDRSLKHAILSASHTQLVETIYKVCSRHEEVRVLAADCLRVPAAQAADPKRKALETCELCNKQFDPAQNVDGSCAIHHRGTEGLLDSTVIRTTYSLRVRRKARGRLGFRLLGRPR